MFEKIIRSISQLLTVVVMFALADSFYLNLKGFVWQGNGFVLINQAEAAPAPADQNIDTRSFTIEEQRVLGDKNAPITIYEFSSLGCTHCSDFHLDILPKLRSDFIDKGLVKLVFADFPIDKKSMQAAMLARCMPEDKYFDFLSILFKKQGTWSLSFKSEKLLSGYAEMEGISSEEATACLEDKNLASEIMYVRQQAMEKLHIQATPSFLIRFDDSDELITGVPDYKKLSDLLNKKISG